MYVSICICIKSERIQEGEKNIYIYVLRPRENASKCETTETVEKDITKLIVV